MITLNLNYLIQLFPSILSVPHCPKLSHESYHDSYDMLSDGDIHPHYRTNTITIASIIKLVLIKLAARSEALIK